MTDSTGENLPSRRALRESATAEAAPGASRRELRLREEQARALHEAPVGAVPPQVPLGSPLDYREPAFDHDNLAQQGMPQAPVYGSALPPPPPPPPPSPPPPPPTLSRRERRVLEQMETGSVPLGNTPAYSEQVAPVDSAAVQQKMPWEREVLSGMTQQPSLSTIQPAVAEAAPLPPVFSPPPMPQYSQDLTGDVDVMTASARTVGAGPLPTHALILPTAPSLDVSGPLGTTGEILVTGQIPLPQSMSETGVQGVLDDHGDSPETFDRLIGAESSFTAPMRAVQAISSRGEGKDFEIVRKPRWSVGAMVLGVSALLLVLAAGALIAVALLTETIQLPSL